MPFAGGTEPCSEVCPAPRASSPLFSALLDGLALGAGTALYVIGQMLERLLKDAPDDG